MDCSAIKVNQYMMEVLFFISMQQLSHCWYYKHSDTNSCLCSCLQCSLHIHAAYSTAMRLNVPMLPLSEPNAVGLILAHGNFQSSAFLPDLSAKLCVRKSHLSG